MDSARQADLPDLGFCNVVHERCERFETALGIAVAAHLRQRDLAGEEYIWHPMRVALAVRGHGHEYAVVGILHDVIEDCPNMASVIHDTFTERVCAALEAITRRTGEDYDAYLRRVMANDIARTVKQADAEDNLRRWSLLPVTTKHQQRRRKYLRAVEYLKGRAA